MKFLKIFFGIIIALVVIFFIGAQLLPKTYLITRNTVINSPDSLVYSNVADFHNFLKWNPWYKMDTTAKIVITEAPGQPGHLYTWDSEKTGQGEMVIKSVTPFRSIDHELKILGPFGGIADNQFAFTQVPGGTKVVWTMTGENDSSLKKWTGLLMEKMMGKDFESGLKDLKELSEKQ